MRQYIEQAIAEALPILEKQLSGKLTGQKYINVEDTPPSGLFEFMASNSIPETAEFTIRIAEIPTGDGTTRTVSYKSCTETPLPGELESSYYLGCSHVIFVDGVRNEFQHMHYFFSAIRRVNDDGTLSYI